MYTDADGDGYGTGNVIIYCSKDKPAGYSTINGDCDDADGSVHQKTMYYVDADGDGFGSTSGQLFCLSSPPVGYSRYNSDCDDNNAAEQCCVFTAPMSFSQSPYNGNCYALTNGQNQVGAIWGNESISLNKDFSLDFNTSQTSGSQGMMFVLQTTGTFATGSTSAAGSLGYFNSPDFLQSIGIELDNANSGAGLNDLSAAHISIVKNGNSTPVAGVYDLASSFSDVTKNIKITWNHTTKLLSVYLDGVIVLTYTNDLVNNVFAGNASVYFGFTSANEPLSDPKANPASQEFCVNNLIYDHELKISPDNDFICNRGVLMTNATLNCTFLWSTGATTPTIEITQSGSYSVTITNPEGCVTTVFYNAVVHTGPVITASATKLCPDGSITLTSSTASSYLWSTNETTRSISVNTPGEYTVSNGVCSASQSIIIEALVASIHASGSTNLCPGESVQLTASEGTSYVWSTGATSRQIIADATGTYTVNITFAAGCTLEASVDIIVGAMAKAHVFASNNGHPYNCNNPVVELNQDTYAEYDQYTFSWYKVGLEAPMMFESPTSYLQVNQPGEYYLIVKRNDCTSDTSDHLNVNYDNGDPSVFGDHSWNVYVWQDGPPSPQNPSGGLSYKGYYTELGLSFDTRNRWPAFLSPSFAPGYQGCPVNQEFFKWSAKRKGFIPGNYSLSIPAYDQSALLKVNGLQVWSDVCCSISGNSIVWTGYLDANSEIEFSVTEELGPAFGAIQFETGGCSVAKPSITVNGSTSICEGNTLTLMTASGFDTYIWMNGDDIIPGAITNSIQVNDTGHYIVQVVLDTCVSEKSEAVVVTVLPITTYYRDADGDGFGNLGLTLQSCDVMQGYVLDHTDCDDSNSSIHPGAAELCDGKDNNCDGNIDEGITTPLMPVVNVIQPTCILTTGTITITNKSSADSASFNNGVTYQISNIKSGLLPGNYVVKIKSIQGCLSDGLSVSLNAVASIPATPIVSVVQPICTILTGSITITNKEIADSASFNNGISYQITDTKIGFSPGTYSIKIKNVAGCISSSLSVSINSAPSVITAPNISIIQPTCLIPSGTITITNKAVLDSASFDQGLSYQISNIKSGLSPGTYVILIKNSGGCVSSSINAVIDPIPANTQTPVLNIIQPSCTVLSGTIEVTNKAKKDSVSFNNGLSYQISAIKTGLIPGNYQVMIKSVQGCVSNIVLVLINVAPQVPAFPTVISSQPTCQSPFGIIEITNKTITDSASFDNGKTYQVSNIKTDLIPGKYIVLVKNIGGCTSGPLSVTINILSSAPAAPQTTIVQPTCLIPTGTSTITNKAVTDSASFDNGISYQISNIKSSLQPGTYSLRIKNGGGCISNSTNAIIAPIQNNLTAPTINISQPSCAISTGTIEVTNKAKKDSVSFNNGITYQISASKSGLTSGNYMIILKTVGGCSTSAVLVIINNAPGVPSNPLLQLVQPTCIIPTGTISLTNKSTLDSASFNNGLSYQISETKSGLTPGVYSIKIKNQVGCISGVTQAVIVASPGALATPSLLITQPTCITPTGTITISNKSITDSASFNNGLTYQIGSSINNLTPGNYVVRLKSPSGCTSTSTTGIINQVVPLTVSISNLDTIYYRNTSAFTLIASPSGGVFKIDATIPIQDKFDPTTLSLGYHTVTYTLSKNGCTAIVTRQVNIKTFSLEGEGVQCYGIQDSLNATLYAGVLNGSIAANIEINQQTYLDSLYQKWIVTDVNGYKRIRNNKSGLYLKALNSGTVVQGVWDTVSAEWVLVPNAGMNSFSLFSRSKEKYLTLGKKNSYTLATSSSGSGPGPDQKFNFIKVNCITTLSLTSNPEVLETRESIDKLNEPITIEIYPNPNKGVFTVRFNHLDLYQKPILTIYTLLGQKIWEQKIDHTSPVKIQLSGDVISNGIYIVKLKSGNTFVLKNMLISN